MGGPRKHGSCYGSLFITSVAPFTNIGLTLIPAWISNYMPDKVWDEIIYPFLIFNGFSLGMDK